MRPQFDARDVSRADIIGDLHGVHRTLRELATALGYDAEYRHPEGRTLVLVGDLVDRGPGSAATLLLAMALSWPDTDGRVRLLAVMGNHEHGLARRLRTRKQHAKPTAQVTLDGIYAAAAAVPDGPAAVRAALRGFDDHIDPVLDGWLDTIVPMLATADDMLDLIASWISELPTQLHLDDGKVVVSHAGTLPHLQGRDTPEAAQQSLFGLSTGTGRDRVRHDFAATYEAANHLGVTVVTGHHHTVTVTDHVFIVDGDAVAGGDLVAVSWPERTLTAVPAVADDLPTRLATAAAVA